MTLKERIISLLQSGTQDNVILAAKWLLTVESEEEQVAIFEAACNDDLYGDKGKVFLSKRVIRLENRAYFTSWSVMKEGSWEILQNYDTLYLVSPPYASANTTTILI